MAAPREAPGGLTERLMVAPTGTEGVLSRWATSNLWVFMPLVPFGGYAIYRFYKSKEKQSKMGAKLRREIAALKFPSAWTNILQRAPNHTSLRRMTTFGIDPTPLAERTKPEYVRKKLNLIRSTSFSVGGRGEAKHEELIALAKATFRQSELMFDKLISLMNDIDTHLAYFTNLRKKKLRLYTEMGPGSWWDFIRRGDSLQSQVERKIQLFQSKLVQCAVHLGRIKHTMKKFNTMQEGVSNLESWGLEDDLKVRQLISDTINMNASLFEDDGVPSSPLGDTSHPNSARGSPAFGFSSRSSPALGLNSPRLGKLREEVLSSRTLGGFVPPSQEDLVASLVDSLSSFLEFESEMKHLLDEHGKPPSIRRKWVFWLSTSCMLSWASVFLYRHSILNGSSDLERWYIQGTDAVKEFFFEHVTLPIQNTFGIVFEKRKLVVADPRDAIQTRRSLQKMLFEFACDVDPPRNSEENADLLKRAEALDMNIIAERYDREMRAPLYHIFCGNIIRMILVFLSKMKMDFHVMDEAMDKLIEENLLTAELAATIPAIVFAGLVSAMFHRLYKNFVSKHREFQRMRSILRDCERTLNKQGSGQSLAPEFLQRHGGDATNDFPFTPSSGMPQGCARCNPDLQTIGAGPVQALRNEWETDGMLTLWLSRFALLSAQCLVDETHDRVMDDLSELSSESYSSQQKINVISRMYRTYRFLALTR